MGNMTDGRVGEHSIKTCLTGETMGLSYSSSLLKVLFSRDPEFWNAGNYSCLPVCSMWPGILEFWMVKRNFVSA